MTTADWVLAGVFVVSGLLLLTALTVLVAGVLGETTRYRDGQVPGDDERGDPWAL